MATQKITETLDTAAIWLDGIEANVDILAEGMSDADGQCAANPRRVSAALYGVLNQIKAVQREVKHAQALANGGEK